MKTMNSTEKYAWVDGEIVPSSEATIHLTTHSLHYGLGIFEGTRFYEQADGTSAIFRLEDHLKRLEDSAKIVQFELPFDRDTLRSASLELARKSGLTSGYLRHLVFLGEGPMGIYPKGNPIRTAILCWPWGAYLGEEGLASGIRCRVSSYCRHHPNAAMLKAKVTGSYANSIMAKKEAVEGGYDEAIMLDVQGFVAEGSGENLFMVSNGELATAPLTSVLSGITRDTILRIAGELGVPTREKFFTRDELYLADEVFLTGTAAEVTPVRQIDDRTIGEGRPGPITQKLQELFFRIVRGEEEGWSDWNMRIPGTGEERLAAVAAEQLAAS